MLLLDFRVINKLMNQKEMNRKSFVPFQNLQSLVYYPRTQINCGVSDYYWYIQTRKCRCPDLFTYHYQGSENIRKYLTFMFLIKQLLKEKNREFVWRLARYTWLYYFDLMPIVDSCPAHWPGQRSQLIWAFTSRADVNMKNGKRQRNAETFNHGTYLLKVVFQL